MSKTLTTRRLTIDLDEIHKIQIEEDDVIIVQADMSAWSGTQRMNWIDAIQRGFKDVFPENKTVVLDKNIRITIASLK
jgi:aminoglycoside N3'-acetyltransferase